MNTDFTIGLVNLVLNLEELFCIGYLNVCYLTVTLEKKVNVLRLWDREHNCTVHCMVKLSFELSYSIVELHHWMQW